MELWGRMLRALVSGLGRRGGTQVWAFSSWQTHLPLAGLLSATEVVSYWTAVFEKRGIPEARDSSEYIVAHVLGAKTFQSLRPVLWTQPLTPWQLQHVKELSSRRLRRMPVQYILGEWDFQGLNLKMVPPVFIPRPETESRVIAVDKGEAAICLTHENAQRLQLQDRIRIIPLDVTLEGSWAHLLPWGPMDLVVSNPPYVFHQDMEQLAPEIRSYEDPAALDGGEEGMDVITHVLALAPWLLKDSGSIFLEVDPRHPELVGSWLQSRPDLSLHLVAVRRDFCGRPRFLHIRRSGLQPGCPTDTWPGH
ncbi:MTRF1L release factor glutamine methyltransferase isoform X2 [Diceros bicornis minor]|uniref:MTRF1L release factor glutamine methyltransferase isoform X2 n=1 Tax=Diceros bicornis minor TaxID=77932 RepID=UPI0026F2B24C|nr:MTRF1L release factor glutamine methyltransferase isoform X2 [Diceros bicornis minor]